MCFKRYANPTEFLDVAIAGHNLATAVDKLQAAANDDLLWEFYLQKVNEPISFDTFKRRLEEAPATKEDLETAVQTSYDILDGFDPY